MSWESHTPRAAWTVGPGALLGHGQQASGQQPLVPLSPPLGTIPAALRQRPLHPAAREQLPGRVSGAAALQESRPVLGLSSAGSTKSGRATTEGTWPAPLPLGQPHPRPAPPRASAWSMLGSSRLDTAAPSSWVVAKLLGTRPCSLASPRQGPSSYLAPREF